MFDPTAEIFFFSCVFSFQRRTYIQDSPSGCVRREIPGVTQVDEKGHDGNTALVTAYLCWRKHGQRNSKTRVPANYCTII